MMKLAYYFTRKQFGKVLTPLKVQSARMPFAFAMFAMKIGKLDGKLQLPPETRLLIREQVARINVCLFCIDIGRSFTIKAKFSEAKFDAPDPKWLDMLSDPAGAAKRRAEESKSCGCE
jgi:hypothetical protein